MKRIKQIGQFLFLIAICSLDAGAKEFSVFYLGGQSNMDGYGYIKELPDALNHPVEGVMMFHGNTSPDGAPVDGKGIWATLQPGHGVGFSSDGKTNKYSNRFGVEHTFAMKMKELNPSLNVALIKYSRGGTSIDISAAANFGCWDPDYSGGEGAGKGVNQYDHFLATLQHAFPVKDIDRDGEEDVLVPAGILWMQGESDANSKEVAEQYETNLKRMIDLFRAALRVDDLPVVIGRISDSGKDDDGKVWDFGDIVRNAEADFVKKDACAALVTSTDSYDYSDKWHYDGKGYIDFGQQFALKMNDLLKK